MRQERRQKKQNALILNIIIDIKIKLKIKVEIDKKKQLHQVIFDMLSFWFFKIGINGSMAINSIKK